MSDAAVRCEALSKRFGDVQALDRLGFELESGRTLALLGPSGCGKTTALRLIAGFERADAGTVAVGGRLVEGPGAWVPPERRRVGMVFQEYALFPHLTVAENVSFGVARSPDRRGRVAEVLELVELAGHGDRMPHELSGGQQQRVALARALAPRPEVLLLDEPFSNLDASLRAQVRRELRGILSAGGVTTIFVTHDQEEALLIGDMVGVLRQGFLEQLDTAERIFHSPATRFVAEFMGVAHFLPTQLRDGSLWTEVGAVPWPRDVPRSDAVEIMVRPDDLVLEPSENAGARITGRVFQGMSYMYEVALESGTVLHVQRHHTQRFPVGAGVLVRLSPEERPTYFANGRLVERSDEGAPRP